LALRLDGPFPIGLSPKFLDSGADRLRLLDLGSGTPGRGR